MERREHYDPEDLEQLLLERSFDELLEEERAYVLRHLTGRDEYESMRELLHAVQRSEPDHELLDAEPHVRDHVLQVFRDQHKPQWRVWLNSVGASLLPQDASAMWRPALALAGLAVVIGVGVWMLRDADGPTGLAEVKPLPTVAPARPAKPAEESVPVVGPEATSTGAVETRTPEPLTKTMEEPAKADGMAEMAPVTGDAADAALQEQLFAIEENKYTEDLAASSEADRPALADSLLRFDVAPAATNSGYLDNWSMANSKGVVTREVALESRKTQKAKDAGKEANALQADDGTLALLRAAW